MAPADLTSLSRSRVASVEAPPGAPRNRLLLSPEHIMHRVIRTLALSTAAVVALITSALAQGGPLSDSAKARRWAVENELASLAIIERKVMIPMRDGVRIAADIYHPKDQSKKYPAIWVRTPYNFNFWDIQNGVPRDMSNVLNAIKRGYAWVERQ